MRSLIVVSSILLLCLFAGCSDSDSGTVTDPVTVPLTPSGLSVTDTGFTTLSLSWGASDGATEYILYRSTTQVGNYTQVYSGALTEFVDSDLAYAATYYYQVSAANTAGESDASDSVSGITDTPAGFTVSGSPSGSVDYTFNYFGEFNDKPHYQSDPIGLNIRVPISGDHAGQWCFDDQIEQMILFYHSTVSDYPSPTGWRAVLDDLEVPIVLTPF